MLVNISAKELSKLMGLSTVLLVDVREPFEYNDGYIANSINMPLSKLSCTSLENEVNNKNIEEIVFICKAGVRSVQAYYDIIEHNNCPEVVFKNLQGGIVDWIANKYEIVKQ